MVLISIFLIVDEINDLCISLLVIFFFLFRCLLQFFALFSIWCYVFVLVIHTSLGIYFIPVVHSLYVVVGNKIKLFVASMLGNLSHSLLDLSLWKNLAATL